MDRDVIGGMLQSLEHLLDGVDRVSVLAGQLVTAQKTGKPLSPQTLAHYEQQLSELDRQRAHIKDVIARWWTLVDKGGH